MSRRWSTPLAPPPSLSTNWSGYAVPGSAGAYSSVSSSWTDSGGTQQATTSSMDGSGAFGNGWLSSN